MKNFISFNSNFLYKNINKKINNFKKNILTRFAPEANSVLHIGHLKNIFINIEISKIYNGNFIIRIDDTNPKKNKNLFIKNIKLIINWLNKESLKKYKITFSSYYFNKLYQYIEFLIKKKLINIYNVLLNFYYKDIEKNLKILRKIKYGNFKEKTFIIIFRIKSIFINKYVLYRILYKNHHKVKYNWFIFPLYNYSNIIIDKIQNTNFSICTLEFIKYKKFYKLFCNLIYKNILVNQYEFSRLKIENNITSKRKLIYLKKNNIIKNLNDKRLSNVLSFIKKGFNIYDINLFCKNTGITKNSNLININLLENIFKKNINDYYYKFLILNPIKIIVLNYNLINNKNIYLSKYIIIEKYILIKKIKNFVNFLKNFNIFYKLKNMYIIYFKNFYKNKFGFIKIIKCIYINKIKIKFKFNIEKVIFWINKTNITKINIKIYKELLKNNYNKFKIYNINFKSKKNISIITKNFNTNKYKRYIYYNLNNIGYFLIKNFFKINFTLIIKKNLNSTLHDLNV